LKISKGIEGLGNSVVAVLESTDRRIAPALHIYQQLLLDLLTSEGVLKRYSNSTSMHQIVRSKTYKRILREKEKQRSKQQLQQVR